VTFRFNNTEATPHDFVIRKDGERIGGTDLISDESAEVTVTLAAGQYTFVCTPHESAGMTGTLTVRRLHARILVLHPDMPTGETRLLIAAGETVAELEELPPLVP
jgi:hypothetical protein